MNVINIKDHLSKYNYGKIYKTNYLNLPINFPLNKEPPPGIYEVIFETSSITKKLASDVYFYSLQLNDY